MSGPFSDTDLSALEPAIVFYEAYHSQRSDGLVGDLVAVNDDGQIDEFDYPIWETFTEIICGARRLSIADGKDPEATYTSRPGRVFRRHCVLHRVSANLIWLVHMDGTQS